MGRKAKQSMKKERKKKEREDWDDQSDAEDNMSEEEENLRSQTTEESFHPNQSNPITDDYEDNPTVKDLSEKLAALREVAFNGLKIIEPRLEGTRGGELPDPDDLQQRYEQVKASFEDYYTMAKFIVRKRSKETKMFRSVVQKGAVSDQAEFLDATKMIIEAIVQLRLDIQVTGAAANVDKLLLNKDKPDKKVTIDPKDTTQGGAKKKISPSYNSTPNRPPRDEATTGKNAEVNTLQKYEELKERLQTIMVFLGNPSRTPARTDSFGDMFYRAEGLETAIQNTLQTARGNKDWKTETPTSRRDYFKAAMDFQMASHTFMGALRERKRKEYDPWKRSQDKNTHVKEAYEEWQKTDESQRDQNEHLNMTSASEGPGGNYVNEGSNSEKSPSEPDLDSLGSKFWENITKIPAPKFSTNETKDKSEYIRDPGEFRKTQRYARNVTVGGQDDPSQMTQSIKEPEWISVETKMNPSKNKPYFTKDIIEDWNVVYLNKFNSLMFVDEEAPRLASSLTKFKAFDGEKPGKYDDFKDSYISAILLNRNLNYAMKHQALMESLEGIAKKAATFKRPKGLVNLANCFEKLDKEFGGPTTRKTGLINAIKNLPECNMYKVHTLQEAKYTVEELLNEMDASGTVDKDYSYQLILPLIKHDDKTQSDFRQYRRLRGLTEETIDNWMTWIGDLIEDNRRTRYDQSLAAEIQVPKNAKVSLRTNFKPKRFPPFRKSSVFLTIDGERTTEPIEEESEGEPGQDESHDSEQTSCCEHDVAHDPYQDQSNKNPDTSVLMTSANNESLTACVLCLGGHHVTECPDKGQVSPNVMKSLLWTNHICFGCGEGKHLVRDCPDDTVCGICKQRGHPTILHGATWTSAQVNRKSLTGQSANTKKQTSFLENAPRK
jgi:hypothetical protein